MRRIIFVFLALVMAAMCFSCNKAEDNTVVIYASSEDFRNEMYLKMLNDRFPDYNIVLQYYPTGNNAAKLMAEGKDTECDIIIALESSYLEQLSDILADLSAYDDSQYLDQMKVAGRKYLVWERFSGCIILNKKVLAEKGLDAPKSYDDLLDPKYKDLVVMPNPKSSGTGYFFLKNMINVRGEQAAFDYFNRLSENILQFTSSGSGPVNMLSSGEAAIGLGMVFQAVNAINNGNDLEIIFFEEGSPYSTDGFAMIDGKQNKKAVKEVFDYLYSDVIKVDKDQFSPDQIFKDQVNHIVNYPVNVKYADMTGIESIDEKLAILEKWTH